MIIDMTKSSQSFDLYLSGPILTTTGVTQSSFLINLITNDDTQYFLNGRIEVGQLLLLSSLLVMRSS